MSPPANVDPAKNKNRGITVARKAFAVALVRADTRKPLNITTTRKRNQQLMSATIIDRPF
jgi:hypothetical protein